MTPRAAQRAAPRFRGGLKKNDWRKVDEERSLAFF